MKKQRFSRPAVVAAGRFLCGKIQIVLLKQREILQAFGENGNYDVFPIATLNVPEEDEAFSEQEQDQAPGMEMGMAP